MSIDAALKRREDALAPRLAEVLERAAGRVPGFASRLAEAGLTASEVCRAGGLAALPVLAKDDLVERQRQDPPHGGLLAPDALVARWFQSPGPLYEPQLEGADWRWGQALADLGVGASDVVLNCFGYHLSPAGAMLEQGARSVGAAVVAGGIGNQDLQARAMADLGVTAYTGLPSYLKALVEAYDAAGLEPERWRLERALVTAEPLPDSLRALLTQRVPHVRMAYGTGETGLLAWEPAGEDPGNGLVLADGVDVQVCEIGTGVPVTDGTEGEIVVTLLRSDYPLVRFGTGDLSGWMLGPDGSLRLRGVLGRVGAAVKVKGMFLHPRQVSAVMDGVPGVADYRFLIDRVDHKDELSCLVVPDGTVPGETLAGAVAEKVRAGLRFRTDVQVVEALGEADGVLLDRRDWS
ncbi:phenylacetate--CoA ligase family protein [Ornithinimicrobium tianjinense]|uniref:Coenzyme F390 synthetase n=1 Tax=Ornithinimicrobium tianjinense TaxID=1195761 RepID=A0A917BTU0_9MICO|nr:AMP-binding protein [Ornithinimicrobium tianjinense]GGF58497.1 coenzyme F390 synthetase [Ornithinimicrobium tianjinense]